MATVATAAATAATARRLPSVLRFVEPVLLQLLHLLLVLDLLQPLLGASGVTPPVSAFAPLPAPACQPPALSAPGASPAGVIAQAHPHPVVHRRRQRRSPPPHRAKAEPRQVAGANRRPRPRRRAAARA